MPTDQETAMAFLKLFNLLRPVAVLLALTCTFLFAPGSHADEVRIAVSKTPLSLPFFIAKDKGFFTKNGLSPELIHCVGGVKCLQIMLDGKADLATCSELPVVFNSFERNDFAVIASFVTNKNDMKLIVRDGVRLDLPRDFEKLKVGVVRRSASQYFFDVFMLFNGVDPSSVQQVGMAPAELPKALADGRVDAIAAWEPFGFYGRIESKGAREVKAPNLYTQTFNMVANKSYLKTSNDVIAILKSLQMASDYIKSNPEESREIMKREVGVPEEFVQQAWSTYKFELSLKQSLITTMVNQAKWAHKEGHVQPDLKLPNILNVVDSSYLSLIQPDAVNFRAR